MKQYNYISKEYPARPRSKRWKDTDGNGGSSGIAIISGGNVPGNGGVTDHSRLAGIVSTADEYSEFARDIHLTAADARKISSLEIIESTELDTISPSDDSVYSSFSTDIRIVEELEDFLDEIDTRYLRKDIDDKASGNIDFDKNIFVKGEAALTDTLVINAIYSDIEANDFEAKGFYVNKDGEAWFGDLKAKGDSMFAGNLSSPAFVSGFPAGTGWALTWRDVMNAAGMLAKKAHLEIDDLTVRGILRVYEMVISQLLGENGTHLTTDMMKIKSVDIANRIIYLDTEEGELYNPFWKNDILMVQRFNGMPTAENGYYVTRQYEFVVEETHIGGLESGENRVDWIKFKNFVGDFAHMKERDTLVRVDNLTNIDRKGLIKQTSVEPGSPYMDIIYGMKTDPENAVKTRVGKLEGLITPYWGQLQKYGIMCDNFYGKGHFMLHTGEDVKTKFEVMENYFSSEMTAIRKEFPESNNLLRNASFSKDTLYWIAVNQMQIYKLGNNLVAVNGSLYSNKLRTLKLINDGTRNVLKIRDNEIKQLNADINKAPDVITADGETHSPAYFISFRYRCTLAGKLKVGFAGSDLYFEQDMTVTEEYEIFEAKGNWNGEGDFILAFSGEIYIYALALTSNALADTELVLSTQILQTSEYIKLLAKKEYVDAETGKVYTKYDASLSVMAQEIAARVTRQDFDTITGAIQTEISSGLSIQAGQISAVSTKIDNVKNTIDTAGWINTTQGNVLFASKTLENGQTIIDYINQTPGNTVISSSRINLYGAVTFSMFDPNLQGRLNGKVNNSDLGRLAKQDYVYASDLSWEITNEITNKVSSSALRNYAFATGEKITKSDLVGLLQTEITNKLTGSTTANSENKLVNAIINGYVLVAGGYIQANLINADDIWCTSLAAVRGSIGGFDITGSRFVNKNVNAGLDVVYSGTKFVYINGNSAMISARHDGGTCISANAYDNGGIALSLLANSYSKAIESYGPCYFGLRNNEKMVIDFTAGGQGGMFFWGIRDNVNQSVKYSGDLSVHYVDGRALLMIKQ